MPSPSNWCPVVLAPEGGGFPKLDVVRIGTPGKTRSPKVLMVLGVGLDTLTEGIEECSGIAVRKGQSTNRIDLSLLVHLSHVDAEGFDVRAALRGQYQAWLPSRAAMAATSIRSGTVSVASHPEEGPMIGLTGPGPAIVSATLAEIDRYEAQFGEGIPRGMVPVAVLCVTMSEREAAGFATTIDRHLADYQKRAN
jgi:hypothetical protein